MEKRREVGACKIPTLYSRHVHVRDFVFRPLTLRPSRNSKIITSKNYWPYFYSLKMFPVQTPSPRNLGFLRDEALSGSSLTLWGQQKTQKGLSKCCWFY